MIMRGAVAARHDNCFERYVGVVFRAMWEQEKKMDDPAEVRAVLQAGGLDAERLIERTQAPDVKQELVESTNASVARGTFGSPTFFVGQEMFFGKDQLRDVEEAIIDANG
jgi:2-hydroxychromene-2-carboxylate isomerase